MAKASGRDVVEIGLPRLSDEQVVKVVEAAERAAREYVLSVLPAKKAYDIGISVQAEGEVPLTITVDIELRVASSARVDPDELAKEAAKKALETAEAKLRELALVGRGA